MQKVLTRSTDGGEHVVSRAVQLAGAIVVISAELPELLGICDRIVVLKEGVSTGELSREEASQERLMELMT